MFKLGHIEIFVSDPMKAKAFYQDILDFRLVTIQEGRFVWLERDGLEFLLRPDRKALVSPTYQDAPSAIVLYTQNLAETRRALEAKGLQFLGTDGSPDCLTFRDPDGNWFQLVENE